jgi:hypothetical protein
MAYGTGSIMLAHRRFKTWAAASVVLGGALALAGGCGNHNSSSSSGAAGAGSNEGGSPSSSDVTTCRRTSECGDQVCSPDGICVDCYEDNDCKAGEHCAAEQCVASASTSGGAPSEGGATQTASGGTTSNGGTTSRGNAGDTGNMGGDPGSDPGADCNTARVLFVIQRSGAMFELPTLQANYWSMVENAIAGEQGAAAPFEARLDMGALFFVRRTSVAVACPTVSSMSPKLSSMTELLALFDQNFNAYMAEGLGSKLDAPTAEAVTAASALLSGSNRHLVLISTAVPDTCTVVDNNCATDPAIKAVQDAHTQGVTTHVIGLGDTPNLDYADKNGYEAYLAALANAGAGLPVKMYDGIKFQCFPVTPGTATYSETSGTAKAYQATDAISVKSAVSEILSSICP